MVALAILGVAALVAAIHVTHIAPPPLSAGRMKQVPRLVLWAWERREDLSFIDPSQTAVAYLDRTLELSGNRVLVRPRFQPLIVPRAAILIPVARIETDFQSRPALSHAQCREAARVIAEMAQSSPPAIQIDFDATVAQRSFYRDLLATVRRRIPATAALSITALASWCMYDDWVFGLPVDEIVPMVYRMGPDAIEIRSWLRQGHDFRAPLCRPSIGLSTDEELDGLASGKRVYLFSPRKWTSEQIDKVSAEVAK